MTRTRPMASMLARGRTLAEGPEYRCEKAVHYPNTLYQDGRCETCHAAVAACRVLGAGSTPRRKLSLPARDQLLDLTGDIGRLVQ